MRYLIPAFIACLSIASGFTILFQIGEVIASRYRYERDIGSNWSLAVKASTIQQKAEYVNRFVAAYKAAGISGHNAIIFKTPDNSVEENLKAVESLQQRLNEVQGMDIQSFAYQTAIQQITQQEQVEAGHITDTLLGAWLLHGGYWFVWDWVSLVVSLVCVFVGVVSGMMLADDSLMDDLVG